MAERRPPVGNLPADLTSFVGRGEELAQVRQLLSESRLVTLTGVGGVGKSRLALRVAQQLSRVFSDGTWLVELSSLQDAALLPQAIWQALGLADQASGDPVEALSNALARRTLLVVVDNCEHLVPACQLLLTALLRAAPGLRVLATSREVLRIPGEQVCEVAPLGVPRRGETGGAETIAAYPGVALFARRAGEVQPVFAVTTANAASVAQICDLSEGLPLFLELAAAQLRSLSVEQLAVRLEDRFQLLTKRSSVVVARHQSLRAAVEWSFTLCTDAERLVWVRASVFAGRFDLDAAEYVCAGEGLPGSELLDALAGLIDKSGLVCDERDGVRRYWMLDTLRAYGLEQLRGPPPGVHGSAGEVELRRRHRDYYLGLAERFSADWFGPRQREWSQRIHAVLPELRAALSFCLATPGEAPAAVRLAGTLSSFWHSCGAAREGSLWLERALAADPAPSRDRGRALVAYTHALTGRSLHVEAADATRECLELARSLGDPVLLADALFGRGLNLMHAGDLAAALPLLDDAIERAASLPDSPLSLALATVVRAGAAIADGDPRGAHAIAARSLNVCTAHGERCCRNYALSLLMLTAFMLGDVEHATTYGREGLSGCAALGDANGLALMLEFLAWTASAGGHHHRAARLLGAAGQQSSVNGGNPTASGLFERAHGECAAATRAALGDVRFDAGFSSGADLALADAIAYAHGDGSPRKRQPAKAGPPPGDLPLTRRESEIARLLAEGLTNKQIAHRLVISRRTAEGHVEHILAKLGFGTRTQVAAWMLAKLSAGGRKLR